MASAVSYTHLDVYKRQVLRHFQGKGIYCLNKEQAFLAARDKWRSLQMLLEQGIAVPNSCLLYTSRCV